MGRFMLVQTKYQNCKLSGSHACGLSRQAVKSLKCLGDLRPATSTLAFCARTWLASVCTLFVLTYSPSWAQPAVAAPSQASEATGPARFVLQADGTLVPVAGSSAAVSASSNNADSSTRPAQATGATGGVRRLPDAAPESVTSVAPARAGNAPSTTPNSAVQAGPSIADSDATPAARAVAAARNAMNAKQWTQLASFVPQARGDVLGIYPEYWSLRTQLGSTHMPGVQQTLTEFITKNKSAYLGDRLKGEWILAAARSGDFVAVRALGDVLNPNPQILCAQLEARHMGGQRVTAAEAIKVFAPFGACLKLFDQLVADRVLGSAELMPYLYDAIENNKLPEARRYAAWVFEPADLAAYDAMLREPVQWLTTQAGPRSSARNDIVAIGLARAARADLSATATKVSTTWAAQLPKKNVQWVYGQMGLLAIMNLDSRAYGWYRETGALGLSDTNNAWRVRASLRQTSIDWAWVLQSIDAMGPTQKADAAWVYWRARGLAATGKKQEAEKAYASIVGQFNFYGQLALEELGRQIVAPNRPAPVTAEEVAQARANPGLQRAVTLFKRGWRGDAVPEWNFTIRGMSDRQLMAAAEVARHENIYDRVVNTSERTQKEFDFSQRYIAPFEGRVSAQARQIDVDPAWVYGLIRQESRFIMDARSSAGASGLMQLMPATARWVAGKIGMTDFTPAKVNDFDTNTKLGTTYLSMVLSDLGGSQVLASAGYNAGPGRPMLWRSKLDSKVEGAIFAETIPFNETRDYVKAVMSNAVYYAALFSGQPQSLKQRLGEIVPQPYGRTPLP
jgi:soluble lytic murein transglycosylase